MWFGTWLCAGASSRVRVDIRLDAMPQPSNEWSEAWEMDLLPLYEEVSFMSVPITQLWTSLSLLSLPPPSLSLFVVAIDDQSRALHKSFIIQEDVSYLQYCRRCRFCQR